jgi:Ser/Thr protein kinase RdoA (MazF antagonist)
MAYVATFQGTAAEGHIDTVREAVRILEREMNTMVTANSTQATPDPAMIESLQRLGLLHDHNGATFTALPGGVSSDIWLVHADGRVYCVKRALSKLKVAADWFAPVERNRYEVAWCQIANELVPGAAPRILAHDDGAMLCAMEYLDPQRHKLWKAELREGRADVQQAALAGRRLGRIHAGAAGDDAVYARFPRTDIFHAIRLEPYLEATTARHPDLHEQLFALSRRTAEIRATMIHGDVSPKNILLGPHGPLFLDAECACIGDPAFDIAFCLNHFLLKCLWTPPATRDFLACFHAMAASYLQEVDWEARATLEERAATLLPGLFLARVDGKSPVEYITADADKAKVRRCARALLFTPPTRLRDVANAWQEEIAQ